MTDIISPIQHALAHPEQTWEVLKQSPISDAIPYASQLLELWRAGMKVSDLFFAAKLRSFVLDSSLQTPKARAQMRERAESEEGKKVGETLFLVLERLNDMQKPVWLAKVFAAYLAHEIKASEMRRLASAIDIAFGDDLIKLITSPDGTPPDDTAEWKKNLVTSGLTEFRVSAPLGGTITHYYVSDFGKMLRKAVRDH